MKNSDYFHLAALFLKNNKRQTSNTVRGITFGSVLLIFVFFILISFFFGIMREIQHEPAISSYIVKYNNDHNSYINEEYRKEISKYQGIEDSVVYKEIDFAYYAEKKDLASPMITYYPDIILDDISYSWKLETKLWFYNMEETTNIVTKAEQKFLKAHDYGEAYLAGRCFQQANEVVISSELLDELGIPYSQVLGEKISLQMALSDSYYVFCKDETIKPRALKGKMVPILTDFKIVGVYNARLYEAPPRVKQGRNTPILWLNEADILEDIVEYRYETPTNLSFTYKDSPLEVSKRAQMEGKVFLPYGYNCDSGANVYRIEHYQILQFKSFKACYSYYSALNKYIEESNSNQSHINYKQAFWENSTLSDYRQFYPFLIMICIVFSLFGGLIFFVTLLNLYNTVHYSVQKRKHYLAMCRAMGMKKCDVEKLYIIEILQIVLRGICWSIGISLIACLSFTLGVNHFLKENNVDAIISYQFSFGYYPIVVFILLILNACIVLLFSFILCHRLNKHSFCDLLKE